MKVKFILSRTLKCAELIRSYKMELKELRQLQPMISSSGGLGVKGSNDGEPAFAKNIQKIVDLEREIQDEVCKLLDYKRTSHKLINSLDDNKMKLVLRARFIEGKKIEVIANELGYSQVHIKRILDKSYIILEKSDVFKKLDTK